MSDEEDREEDKDEKPKKDDGIGASTMFNAMMQDKQSDNDFQREVMQKFADLRIGAMKEANERDEKMKERIRDVDRDHHARREKMQEKITTMKTKLAVAESQIQSLQEEGETIFDENGKPVAWYLQPKTWKSFAKGIAAVVLILAAAWGSVVLQNGDEEDQPKKKTPVEAKTPEERDDDK